MFQVIWSPSTMDDLARIWVAAEDQVRLRITEAVSSVDKQLAKHASTVGESRDDPYRVMFEPPLGVEFRVHEGHRLAVISRVWRYLEQ